MTKELMNDVKQPGLDQRFKKKKKKRKKESRALRREQSTAQLTAITSLHRAGFLL